MSIFALPPKEFNRAARQGRLDDLTCKQIAVSLSNVAPCVHASDLLAIGGEYVTEQQMIGLSGSTVMCCSADFVSVCSLPKEAMRMETCRRLRKSKDEQGKTEALTQVQWSKLVLARV